MKGAEITILTYEVLKLRNGNLVAAEELISEESPFTLYLNGQELITMLCSPQDEKYMAIGFLASEGMISSINALTSLTFDRERGLIWAEAENVPANPAQRYVKRCLTACCGRGRAEFYFANDARAAKHVDSQLKITAEAVNNYALILQENSITNQTTHGVHSGAIVAEDKLLFYAEDIGRHNVFDKLYGKCLEAGVSPDDKIISFSGRVSSEIILKTSKLGVPILIARSVPTSLAIDFATELGITLIGSARGDWFQVYSHKERVLL